MHLFMVMLGGEHAKANVELHDVVFVAGAELEQTYPQLRQLWFGAEKGLHMDAWMRIEAVDGYRVQLVKEPPQQQTQKLFFLNLGGYHDTIFGEDHRYLVVVAKDRAEAKQKAKAQQLAQWDKPHTDNVFAVEQCLEINQVGAWFIQLEPTGQNDDLQFENVYIVLPG
ncbi:MAG: DUF1543 domain-containing protein [Alkalimonas sp.]|nr:DUF1543 domain-containing protein [Alkalimonas sp.]